MVEDHRLIKIVLHGRRVALSSKYNAPNSCHTHVLRASTAAMVITGARVSPATPPACPPRDS